MKCFSQSKEKDDSKIETVKILSFDYVSLYPSFSNSKLVWPIKSRKKKIEELLEL
jgi:hypothetical protein